MRVTILMVSRRAGALAGPTLALLEDVAAQRVSALDDSR